MLDIDAYRRWGHNDQLAAALLDLSVKLAHFKAVLAEMDAEPDVTTIDRLHDLGVRVATVEDVAMGRATTLVVGWPSNDGHLADEAPTQSLGQMS